MKLRRNLLIGVDELLDTRLAVLAQHDEALVETLLSTGAWHARLKDEWTGMDRTQFQALYKARNVETLQATIMTNMVKFAREYLLGYNYEAIDEPMRDTPVLTVNFYPYVLDKADRLEFIDVLHHVIGDSIPMKIDEVFLSPDELTPKYCAHQFTTMVMYEGLTWMDLHGKAFEETLLADMELIVPALFLSDTDPDDPVVQNSISDGLHPLKALEHMAKNIIHLQHIDVEHFSIVGFKRDEKR